MKYPNNIKKNYKKEISYKNRGMDLENLINEACKYYLEHDLAIIYKKPTPIGVVDVDYKNGAVISKAYFKEPSTLDYNGIYKGVYIEFDAKECQAKTSFPLHNIHSHQISHIKNIIRHGGIAFLIIYMNGCYYLFKGTDLIQFICENKRKSIPYSIIKKLGYPLLFRYNIGIDYLKGIDEAYKGDGYFEDTEDKN